MPDVAAIKCSFASCPLNSSNCGTSTWPWSLLDGRARSRSSPNGRVTAKRTVHAIFVESIAPIGAAETHPIDGR